MINGQERAAEVPANRLLVDFLREDLEMTGTHVGCDTSQCGACVVHMDGKAVKACAIFAVEAVGQEVQTIEGEADADGNLSALQQAFKDQHALQCGFCTPGMVMSAADLLAQNPKPTEHDIRTHLEGNLCRCTGYHNIINAILVASGQDPSVPA